MDTSAADPHASDRAASPGLYTAKHKSCDACKARKVKCPNANFPAPCANCIRRKTTCRFGIKRVPRRNVSGRTPAPHSPGTSPLRYVDLSQAGSPSGPDHHHATAHANGYVVAAVDGARDAIPMLYIDHMLAHAQDQNLGKAYTPLTKGNGIFGGSYSLTFFSESRLLSLSSRLRNNRVNDLVQRISGVISGRLRRSESAVHESDMLPVVPPRVTTAAVAATAGPAIPEAAGTTAATATSTTSGAAGDDDSPPPPLLVDPPFAAACIRCYFDNVHPQYPFLDRAAFERRAADPDLARSLAANRAWSSLYHAVLAIGCPYAADNDGGGAGAGAGAGDDDASFEPGKGTAWRLFSVALGHFSALLILPDSLITLQALTAMAIYGLGVACLSIERVLLSEAARRAQSLAAAGAASVASPASASATFQRTFWVLYGIEKVMSFHYGRSSSFADSDISCPLPVIPAMPLDDADDGQAHSFDWFLTWIRHARLLSRTYTWLFSVGTSCNSAASSLATIDQLAAEVEAWRLSIPDVRALRPQQAGPSGGFSSSAADAGGSSRDSTAHQASDAGAGAAAGGGPSPGVQVVHRRKRHSTRSGSSGSTRNFEQTTTLQLSFLYHSYMLILARARLRHQARLVAETPADALPPPEALRRQQAASEQVITSSCRAILELTPAIAVEPYTPLWVLAVAPLSSLLVLFDFVIHHPAAPDAAAHLVLLDMGAGYFSRIEYTSGGTLPGSLVSEFAHIARDYVHGRQRQDAASYGGGGGRGDHDMQTQQPQQPQPQPPPLLQHQQHHHQQQQPLPILPSQMMTAPPPPPPPPQQQPTPMPSAPPPPTLPPMPPSFVDTSSLAQTMDWSAVTADATAAGAPGPLGAGPGDATAYGDTLGYGYGFGGPDAGAGDFAGTDVLGLFSYLLPEMDSMLYPGMGDAGI